MPKTQPKAYRLLAFDPGVRTGFVLARVGARFSPKRASPKTFTIERQGVLTINDCLKQMASLVKQADRVTYEVWKLYPDYAQAMIGSEMPWSQVVGMIRYEAFQQRKRITSQGASVKKQALKLMPDWLHEHMKLSTEQHDQDAIMHAWWVATLNYHVGRD